MPQFGRAVLPSLTVSIPLVPLSQRKCIHAAAVFVDTFQLFGVAYLIGFIHVGMAEADGWFCQRTAEARSCLTESGSQLTFIELSAGGGVE